MAVTPQRWALFEFVGFCWRQTCDSGRFSLALEALFLELGGLVIPLYTSFVLVSIGQVSIGRGIGEGQLLAPLLLAATGLILLFLLGRRYLEPRLQTALARDDATARRHMLATYQRSGRLQKVQPETFDDEFEQFCRLGRLVGRDTVKVCGYAMALVVFIPVELIFTGPILLVSLVTAWMTVETVLSTGDAYRLAQWELAEDGIETTARRRLWMRYIKPLAGLYTNSQLMKGLFGLLDRELRTFQRKQRADLGLFGMLDLIGNVERIIMMTLAAIGIVTGFFDISQFVLILFVGGRLQGPLRGILLAWLNTARPVQGMQVMQRLIKADNVADSEDLLAPQPVTPLLLKSPDHERRLVWRRDVPIGMSLEQVDLWSPDLALFRGEAITVNGSLLENLTLGQSELNQTALSLLAWSGLQPWVASLPNGVETPLEEDSAVLPHYVTQLLSAFRVFLFNTTVPVVIDNRGAQLEPETISALVNVLQRWRDHPQITILSSEDAWSQLTAEVAG